MEIRYWLSQIWHFRTFKKSSYSAEGEDLIIQSCFDEHEGTYIDIGAGHPMYGSNSFLFYKKGWKGITVDPVNGHKLLHRLSRNRDTFLQGVVSIMNEKLIEKQVYFYEFNPRELSTISIGHVEEMNQSGAKPRKIYQVSRFFLDELVRKLPEKLPYFISLDVEGYDFELIKEIKNLSRKPKVVCVETTHFKKEIENEMNLLGYSILMSTNLNSIFSYKNKT